MELPGLDVVGLDMVDVVRDTVDDGLVAVGLDIVDVGRDTDAEGLAVVVGLETPDVVPEGLT